MTSETDVNLLELVRDLMTDKTANYVVEAACRRAIYKRNINY